MKKKSGFLSPVLTALLISYTFSILLFQSGCTSPGSGKAVLENDTIKYIRLTDASYIDSSWSAENTVIYHLLNEPDNMHPTNGRSSVRGLINHYTQKALVRVNLMTLEIEPDLVRDLPSVSDDKLSFTYHLRRDVRWDDGSPVTAADVLFTFKANKFNLVNNPHSKPYLDNLKDIQLHPADPYAFTIHMFAPYILNIAFLVDFPLMQRSFFDPGHLLDKYSFAEYADTASRADRDPALIEWANNFNGPQYGHDLINLKGLGSYRIASWAAGQSLILEKKAGHWTDASGDKYERAYPQRIVFVINKDPNSQEIEFKKQAYDATASLSTATLLKLQKDSVFNRNYHSVFIEAYSYSYIAMNMRPDGMKRKKLFTDRRVRRAMALLTPIDTISAVLNSSKARRMISPVFPQSPEFNAELKPLPFDVVSARELLKQAGWADSDHNGILDKVIDGKKEEFNAELAFINNSPSSSDLPLMIKEAYAKAGININLTPLEYSVIYKNASEHDFDMMVGIWTGDYLPQDFAQLWHSSSWLSNGSNFPGFGNQESDRLIDSINRIVEPEMRVGPVKQLQKIIYEEQPYIFLFQGTTKIAVHKRFGNITIYKEKPYLLAHHWVLLQNAK